ncbi:Glutathione synthase/RimK-type ligase, ATP-grasp superfamily [Evansella caseinilytica]|uniref:Glutathione synthase/RimK-type ligase, ATP-grasp superfamily n=1 Tax=Evansella caseinilytica TaxID=1503961 RepID=A0A1H3JZA1_9BACI|nr:YheC/YheD family protein [Evansella caseinilytica]SDY45290.1 Glutathione synthase/RimK-type ligase, ATP-grasp superfamily [Evansella caseinilytica]
MLSSIFYISTITLNEALLSNQLVIPDKMASLWKIDNKLQSTLTFHMKSKEMEIIVSDRLASSAIEMHPRFFQEMGLLKQANIQCIYDPGANTFHLGPYIGTVLGDIPGEMEAPFGPLTPYMEEMAKTAHAMHCMFIVFSYKKLHGTFVEGYQYQHHRWVKLLYPLPQVVYNRIGRRDQECSRQARQFFQRLTKAGIPYFNDRFLHKWETHLLFSRDPSLQPYLPDTRVLGSKNDLFDMLAQYPQIYLKPFRGKEGTGIIRLTQTPDGYEIGYPDDEGGRTEFAGNRDELLTIIATRMKKRQYIMQPMIKTKEVNGSPVDFRILCIKNQYGLWKSCSAIARIGQKNAVVSNLAKGGTQRKAHAVLTEILSEEKAAQTERFMHELACHSAQVLETEAGGLFGELGFDFMIDQAEHVWMLEVNIKPSKGEVIQFSDNSFPSIKLLLPFAAALAGFPPV